MFTLVSDETSRDAYLHVLRDVYYSHAHTNLIGAPPEEYAVRYGGISVRPFAGETVELVARLNARFRYWAVEASKVTFEVGAKVGLGIMDDPLSKTCGRGDASLLAKKDYVSLKTAEIYLGVTERQRQYLVSAKKLTQAGSGHQKKISVASLIAYCPPEKPK